MAIPRPPHPGARPPRFDYPFAEAAAAQRAAEDLADELCRLRDQHDEAWATVEAGVFEGRTADDLRRRLGGLLGAVDDHIVALRHQAAGLADELALAHQRKRENDQAIAAYDAALRAWQDAAPRATPR